jgi:Tol biopolymer transport system component
LFDSDLWLMEAESGALKNLTDDGVVRPKLGSEEMEKAWIDLTPAWSPDGKTLLFARSTWSDEDWQGTTLYKIPAQGGDPKEVLTASDEEPAAVWYSLMWSRDGEKILYTVFGIKSDAPDNGVWMAEADGDNLEHLLDTTDPDLGPPFLLDVSAKGDKALVVYYWALGELSIEPNTSFVALLDLETGKAEPLKRAQSEEIEFVDVGQAIFSPDGSKILYVYRDLEPQWHLVVRDVEEGEENVLLSTEELIGGHRDFGLGLDWADDDTIFVTRVVGLKGGLLLSLEAE